MLKDVKFGVKSTFDNKFAVIQFIWCHFDIVYSVELEQILYYNLHRYTVIIILDIGLWLRRNDTFRSSNLL